MINYIEIQDGLKNLSDDQIKQVVVNPANPMNATLAVAELKRREQMRMDMQARMANPMSTIADQVVTGQPNNPPAAPGMPPGMPSQGLGALPPGAGVAGPAAPSPMGQGPVGMGMADGGAVGYRMDRGGDIDSLRALEQALRLGDLETLQGALGQSQALMGDDPSVALRDLITKYRAGAQRRRGMDMNQLLLRMGAGMMNSRRPDFLGAVGEGGAAGVEGLSDLIANQNAEERQGITDEGAMAGLANSRQGRQLETAMSLFGAGRHGLEQAADVEQGILNADTQLGVAQTYASRPQGGGAGSNVDLRSIYTRATIATNQARRGIAALRARGYNDQDPEMVQALQEQAVLEAFEAQALADLRAGIASGEVPPAPGDTNGGPAPPPPGGPGGPGPGGHSEAAPNQDYATTNRAFGGIGAGLQAYFRAPPGTRFHDRWDSAVRAYNAGHPDEQDQAVTPNAGSYADYLERQRQQQERDAGRYGVRTE